MNSVVKIYLVIYNDTGGQEYVFEDVSDRLVDWWYNSDIRVVISQDIAGTNMYSLDYR